MPCRAKRNRAIHDLLLEPSSPCMQILLTNDDGIYAPGLEALEWELRRLGDVCVVSERNAYRDKVLNYFKYVKAKGLDNFWDNASFIPIGG